MHEWSLAQSVFYTALAYKEQKHLGGITEINVVVGELQQINRGIFESALNEMSAKEGMTPKINVEIEKAIMKCKTCGDEWGLDDVPGEWKHEDAESMHLHPEVVHTLLKCPKCGSSDFEVTKGKETRIKSIRG